LALNIIEAMVAQFSFSPSSIESRFWRMSLVDREQDNDPSPLPAIYLYTPTVVQSLLGM
jgi:hypothetical protein